MLKSSRIKLTAWYLLIIMAVTLSFSGILYIGVSNTAERALEMHERRIEARLREFPRFQNPPGPFQEPINAETVREIKTRLLLILGIVDVSVLVISGILGYFLAGRTLEPIEKMLEKQKVFVADAAHELKTPLTAMRTYLEVNLRNKNLNVRKAKEIMTETIEDVDALTMLTNSLLKQSKYQNYNRENGEEEFKLDEIIKKVVSKLKHKANEKGIEIEVSVTENLLIKADKKSIVELITILLDNAVKFNKSDGHIYIETAEESQDIKVIVKDTGIGISEKDLPYIFDRFYKADTSRAKTKHEGFGLGLSIAKSIVEMHNGNIHVSSEEDRGTTITISLPKKK